MTPLTIIYCTSRRTPQWTWFVDAICRQADFDQRRHLQIVFVDGNLWDLKMPVDPRPSEIKLADPLFHDTDRRLELELIVNNRLDYQHIPPLPTVYQGPFRLTKADWFCASNTRNTGFVAAKYGYVLMIDDLSLPGPGWLDQGLHAAHHGYPVAGMYKKVKKLVVNDGLVESFEEFPEGVDSRWGYGSPNGIVEWDGSIYGCSFGVPLAKALDIDGFEMACCGAGGEDYDFGIRLRRSGAKVMLNQNLFTMESEEGHHVQETMSMRARERRHVTRENLPAAYESYQHARADERHMSDHVLLNRVLNEARVTPILPQNLRGQRDKFLHTGYVDVPTGPVCDWRDNSPLSDIT